MFHNIFLQFLAYEKFLHKPDLRVDGYWSKNGSIYYIEEYQDVILSCMKNYNDHENAYIAFNYPHHINEVFLHS